jgi:hypothetical protein
LPAALGGRGDVGVPLGPDGREAGEASGVEKGHIQAERLGKAVIALDDDLGFPDEPLDLVGAALINTRRGDGGQEERARPGDAGVGRVDVLGGGLGPLIPLEGQPDRLVQG